MPIINKNHWNRRHSNCWKCVYLFERRHLKLQLCSFWFLQMFC